MFLFIINRGSVFINRGVGAGGRFPTIDAHIVIWSNLACFTGIRIGGGAANCTNVSRSEKEMFEPLLYNRTALYELRPIIHSRPPYRFAVPKDWVSGLTEHEHCAVRE